MSPQWFVHAALVLSGPSLALPCLAGPDCGPALAQYDRLVQEHGGDATAAQASAMGDALLNALATTAPGPCRAKLAEAAVVMLGQCGREADAAAAAQDALATETNPARRVMLANNYVGMKGLSMHWRLDEPARAAMRQAARDGLAGSETPEEMVTRERLDELAGVMPLHHVIASTEPDSARRADALRRLLRVCVDAAGVAERRGRASPVEMDRFALAKEIAHEIGVSGAASVDAIIECVRAVPWAGRPNRSAGDVLEQITQDRAIPLRVRRDVLDRLDVEIPGDALRVTARSGIITEMVRLSGATMDPASAQRLYDTVAAHRRWLMELESRTPPGETPGGLAASRWNGILHTTLVQEWELADLQLGRADLAAEPAAEHVRRYPDLPPSETMRHYLIAHGR